MYAKFIHPHKLYYFNTGILKYGGRIYANPTKELLLEAGFKPVVNLHEEKNGERPVFYRDYPDHISVEYEEVGE